MYLSRATRELFALLLFIVLCTVEVTGLGQVIWAVNSGGDAHVDVHGIRYQKDFLSDGVASDYGKSLFIQRVAPQDQILYQTERYHTVNFGYEVPVNKDGDYVIVLKFSEVWFTQAFQKVFDIRINGHVVSEGLDIFARVGRGVAHDEVVPFNLKKGMLKIAGESMEFDGTLIIEFVKLDRDNPKINALYVMRGTLEDVPELPALPGTDNEITEDETEEEDPEEEARAKASKHKRSPADKKVQNPYATDDTSSMMLPIVIALAAFIPLLFCLCKL
ncbi:hypothetical protein CAPTEDRAFT_148335 [Capitella teleta]|uniref:Malectin domain-containing protein n=1 Tax=Capitella teleta TaxID=283909 RepID=R7TKP8_CAPTE|nr:hypothetical protein CAPTEDRAFT_148335 [Capitella teleta]|eukprot:ELT91685.1 hypothetical protein CAPTEDRAFT_148335 [Capitella teleta]